MSVKRLSLLGLVTLLSGSGCYSCEKWYERHHPAPAVPAAYAAPCCPAPAAACCPPPGTVAGSPGWQRPVPVSPVPGCCP